MLYARLEYHTQLAKMSFDEIFDLAAGVFSYFIVYALAYYMLSRTETTLNTRPEVEFEHERTAVLGALCAPYYVQSTVYRAAVGQWASRSLKKREDGEKCQSELSKSM